MALNKMASKVLAGLWIVLAIALSPQPAEAVNVRLENPHSLPLWAAIIYFEDSANKWVTRGWYKVEPHDSRNLNFSSSTKKNSVWIHAYSSEANWGGEGENAVKRTVIKEAFKYYDGQSCPAGSNRRQVSFDRWYVENDGVVYWRP